MMLLFLRRRTPGQQGGPECPLPLWYAEWEDEGVIRSGEGDTQEAAIAAATTKVQEVTKKITFHSVGEPEIHFDFDVPLVKLQRIQDFLAGMGVERLLTCQEWVWQLRMTRSQRDRWNEWCKKNNIC